MTPQITGKLLVAVTTALVMIVGAGATVAAGLYSGYIVAEIRVGTTQATDTVVPVTAREITARAASLPKPRAGDTITSYLARNP